MAGKGRLERLAEGPVICAEGYLFELERRGYVQAGPYVPEVVLDAPEAVRQLHREFVRAGSDVVEAFTYYGHREKLKIIGKEEILEPLNRQALRIAKEVADESGALLAGDLSNTNAYEPDDPQSLRLVRQAFEEQVGWAVDAGVDFIVGETFSWLGEAALALEIIKSSGKPAVMMLAMHQAGIVREGPPMEEACRRLQDAGAEVVGLNCSRGPATMLPAIERIRQSVSCHVAALPVPYRTTPDQPTFHSLKDPACQCLPEGRPFPTALDPFTCNRYEMAEFARAAYAMDVRYLGICCGAGPHHIRALAEALGRRPPASRYSPDMARHSYFGTDPKITASNREYAARL
jgi:betaine-homocysteine S-methyltransferase